MMVVHQYRRTLTQFRRSGRGRRQFVQSIQLGSHEANVRTMAGELQEFVPTK